MIVRRQSDPCFFSQGRQIKGGRYENKHERKEVNEGKEGKKIMRKKLKELEADGNFILTGKKYIYVFVSRKHKHKTGS